MQGICKLLIWFYLENDLILEEWRNETN